MINFESIMKVLAVLSIVAVALVVLLLGTTMSRSQAGSILRDQGVFNISLDTLHYTPNNRIFTTPELKALEAQSKFYTITIHNGQ